MIYMVIIGISLVIGGILIFFSQILPALIVLGCGIFLVSILGARRYWLKKTASTTGAIPTATSSPPPATTPATTTKTKKSRWWIWIISGIVLVAATVSITAYVLRPKPVLVGFVCKSSTEFARCIEGTQRELLPGDYEQKPAGKTTYQFDGESRPRSIGDGKNFTVPEGKRIVGARTTDHDIVYFYALR